MKRLRDSGELPQFSAIEQAVFEEQVLWPLMNVMIHSNIPFFQQNFDPHVWEDDLHSWIKELITGFHHQKKHTIRLTITLTWLTNCLRYAFPDEVPVYCKMAFRKYIWEDLNTDLHNVSNYTGGHVRDLSNDSDVQKKRKEIMINFIKIILINFEHSIDLTIANEQTKKSTKRFLDNLKSELYRSAFLCSQMGSVPYAYGYILSVSYAINRYIIHNTRIRLDGLWPLFAFILNILLFIIFPPILLIRVALHFYNKKNHICWLPSTPFIKQIKAWKKEWEQLKNFYKLYKSVPLMDEQSNINSSRQLKSII